MFGVLFGNKSQFRSKVGREDMTCRRTRKGREGGGREWRREGSETLFHNIKQLFFNLEARAHIPEDDQRTTGESNKG